MEKAVSKEGEQWISSFLLTLNHSKPKRVFSYSVDSVLLSQLSKLLKNGLIVNLCAAWCCRLILSAHTQAKVYSQVQERH